MGDKKNDMERIGLFQEMEYVTIGDKYKSPAAFSFNEAASKGKQMLPGGTKERSALQAGYFTDKFGRILEAEAYSDPVKLRRMYRQKEAMKNIGKAFLPSNGEKKPSGLGSYYGTIGGPVTFFSPGLRSGGAYKAPGKNVLTNPGKKGTGYGYPNVLLGKYPANQSENYESGRDKLRKELQSHKAALKGGAFRLNMHPTDYFELNPYRTEKPLPPLRKSLSASALRDKDLKPFKPSSPGKTPGGMKAGTFDPYPSHSQDAYRIRVKRPVNIVNKSGKSFIPSQGPKSRPVNSIVDQMVTRSMNSQNYRAVTLA
ncbi:UPF0602 protein C4orf47 homolog isoform X2 [Gigantopelta aegis]|uniref:UPF0602 protein C4orf47 homolog isoform X2 n=1 Tax=Gigantopelta aegis TaxID=1735272 RepID=UPI001B88CE2E|nr:UPF0602 protein C4orf47 homolog isoform X2 [Gigantopelta aegis]